MSRTASPRRDPIDEDFWSTSRLFMEVSRPGEASDADDLLLVHCGYPLVQMNAAHVKDPDADPSEVALRARAWFRERELPFRLTLRSDRAAGFAPALEAAGWRPQPGIPAMQLPIARADAGAKGAVADLEVRRVRDDAELAEFQRTAFIGFGLPEAAARLYLTPELRDAPAVTLLLGRVGGRPACTSLVVSRDEVAGIYWVATLPEARGRGLGEAITWAAVRAGADAGCAVASLQASEMGRPVYARMGFEHTWDYARWLPPGQA